MVSVLIKLKEFLKIDLFSYADSNDKFRMLIGILCGIITGILYPLSMVYIGDFIGIFTEQNRPNATQNGFDISKNILSVAVSTLLIGFYGLYSWNLASLSQSNRFKKLYFSTLLDQQIAWYDSIDSLKLSTQVTTNISSYQNAIGQKFYLLITTVSSMLFGFVYAFVKCWELCLVLMISLPFMILSGKMMIKAFGDLAKISKTSYEDASGRVQQAFGAIKTVKSLLGQDYEFGQFVQCLEKGKEKNRKPMIVAALCFSVVMMIIYMTYSLGFWYGKQLIVNKGYTAKDIIATFYTFLVGGAFLGQISPILKNFNQGRVAGQTLNKILKRQKTLAQNSQNGQSVEQIQSIELKNVNFSYPKIDKQCQESLVLQNLNLRFQKNKFNAIVGESGSGKSTISQLLMRFYDPTQGEICINATKLSELNLKSWREKIGYVGQEPVLFSMTIEENIKLSNPNLTQKQIIEILKKANAWQFVQKLQKGIKTYVGTNGAQFSGGQKQRIAIARALAKNPEIMIFDEATSALDRKNQRQIQQTLRNLSQSNITTIMIAHRLSSIKDADKIFVLKNGKLMQEGKHQSLINSKGYYFSLVKNQLRSDSEDQQKLLQEKQPKTISQHQDINKKDEQPSKIQQKSEEREHDSNKKNSFSILRNLFKFSTKHNYLLFSGIFFSLLSGAVGPFFYFFLGQTFGLLSQPIKNSSQINNHCLIYLVLALAAGIFTFLYKYPFDLYGQRVVFDMRQRLFSKLLRVPVGFYDKKQNTPGSLSTILSVDASQLNNVLSGICAAIFMNLSTVAISLMISLYYSWQLTLAVMLLSPLVIFHGSINSSVLKKVSQKTQQAQKYIGSLISETVLNIRTVKVVGPKQVFLQKYEYKIQQFTQVSQQKIAKTSFFDGIGKSMSMFVQGFSYMIAGYMYQNQMIMNGQGVYVTIFTIIFAAGAIGKNLAFMPDMAKAKLACVNLFGILSLKDQVQLLRQKGLGKVQCTKQMIHGNIQFKNVTFKYLERDSVVLNNFSCNIKAESKVAFVGPSGSGKSTLAQILQRFYPIQSGTVEINGINIQNFELYSYRRLLGCVNQQPTLFKGTINQNISYNKQLSSEEIQNSCKISHAHAFINQWHQKYEKNVGTKGSQISGGQKQRIAISRCIIRNPSIYIFDESTSALDTETQKIVSQNLNSVIKLKTTIMIAHRLSTVQDCDKIVMMKDGRVLQQGSYQQLWSKKGYFYNLAKGN